MKKNLYLVETIHTFRMRYVIEAQEAGHADDEVVCRGDDLKEFSQKFIGDCFVDTRRISTDEYLTLFDQDNDYLKSWDIAKKMSFINTIDYGNEKDTSDGK